MSTGLPGGGPGGCLTRLAPTLLANTARRALFVRNLPFNISAEEMYDIFGKYGPIRQVRV